MIKTFRTVLTHFLTRTLQFKNKSFTKSFTKIFIEHIAVQNQNLYETYRTILLNAFRKWRKWRLEIISLCRCQFRMRISSSYPNWRATLWSKPNCRPGLGSEPETQQTSLQPPRRINVFTLHQLTDGFTSVSSGWTFRGEGAAFLLLKWQKQLSRAVTHFRDHARVIL